MSGTRKKPCKVAENRSEIVRDVPLACADEDAAVEFMEQRRWGKNPACACCGSVEVYKMTNRKTGDREQNYRWRCRDCKKMYTVRKGTIMEDSRIPLRHWCFAFWAACSSKKGVSAKQIQRQTGLSYKSALFLMHRIRFAMTDPEPKKMLGQIEVDETYVGGKPKNKKYRDGRKNWIDNKTPVIAAVKRGGEVQARVPTGVTSKNVKQFLDDTVQYGSVLHTDGLQLYRIHCPEGMVHLRVEHGEGEYARTEGPYRAHTNTVEGFWSLFKRKLNGTHHAVSKEHLHRYVGEACFHYNTRKLDDGERLERAIQKGDGKRLVYKNSVIEKCAS